MCNFQKGLQRSQLQSNSKVLRVEVRTVEGRPTIYVPVEATSSEVRLCVRRNFGSVCIGVEHSWYGKVVDAASALAEAA
jgi:hypothetical protein